MCRGHYSTPKSHVLRDLRGICGDSFVFKDHEDLLEYEKDQTLNLRFPFDVLVKPGTTAEISEIVKVCNRYGIPITPRGGGSGVAGGALPVKGGIVLSLERLNKILSINKTDLYVIAESGTVTADLCAAVEAEGLYFPVSPSSSSYSFIGGNVAVNSGSINSCKFGCISRYVINLEVVLPTGKIIWTGANVSKSATGINLTQLFVGSEGVLGIITKVVYRLLPVCSPEQVLLIPFNDLESAFKTLLEIRRARLVLSAGELVGKRAIELVNNFFPDLDPTPEAVQAHLLLGVQEICPDLTIRAFEKIFSIASSHTDQDILVAQTESEKKRLFKIRLNVGNALTRDGSFYRDIDACVPLSELYGYITKVERICAEYGLLLIYFGHAMDGNLHAMISLRDGTILESNSYFKNAVSKIYEYVISVGGVISGEHGIGCLQREFIHDQFPDGQVDLMIGIKSLFDPNGILNPGKIF